MARMMRGTAPEQVEGVWVQCGPIRVLVRPLLPTKDEEFDLSIPRAKVKVNLREGTEERDPTEELRRTNALLLAKGKYALMNTEGFEIEAYDDDWTAFLSKITKREIAKGSDVCIDGFWSDEVKARVLSTIENDGQCCDFETEIEVEHEDGTRGMKKISRRLAFNVWIVWTALKLGRETASNAAQLKS